MGSLDRVDILGYIWVRLARSPLDVLPPGCFPSGSVLIRNFGLEKSHSWSTSFVASGQSLVPGLSVSANLTGTGEAFR